MTRLPLQQKPHLEPAPAYAFAPPFPTVVEVIVYRARVANPVDKHGWLRVQRRYQRGAKLRCFHLQAEGISGVNVTTKLVLLKKILLEGGWHAESPCVVPKENLD